MWVEKRKPYKNCKIYGVYWGKDGRSRVCIIFPDKSRKTISYPKFLMEIKLGRFLKNDETVDHIDGNPKNNSYSNLRILKRNVHAKIDVKRLKNQTFICPMCGKKFSLGGKKLHDAIQNRRKGKKGPFCSKSCAGKYSRLLQLNKVKELDIELIPKEYYKLKEATLMNEFVYKKARLVELGDTTDLSSVGTLSREGSNPSPGIKDKKGR